MNLEYKLSEIAKIIDAEIINFKEQVVNQIFTDSRNFFGDRDSLFIALQGSNNDGHNYISDLQKKGCGVCIISTQNKATIPDDVCALKVVDTLHALQLIAAHHRNKFQYPVIAITGSNGKTIVKEWLYYFLKNKYNISRSPKSYNSKIGVPLSLLQLTKQHNLAIIEAGISHPGEMQILEEMINPNFGILTNIGAAHSENFEDRAAIEFEKSKLFSKVKWFHHFKSNDNYIENVISSESSTEIVFRSNNKLYITAIPFVDNAAIQNAQTTICFLLKFGVSEELITHEAPHLPSIALRLELRKGKDSNVLINDSYSNDLDSLDIALNHLSKSLERENKIVILSDIQQDRNAPKVLYQKVADWIKARGVQHFYGIGPNMVKHRHLFENGDFFESTKQFLGYISETNIQNSLILIKGARQFNFERIGKYFEYKTHETKLTIDLEALRHNVKVYQEKLNPNTKLLCMVKAFGYGSGSKEIGKILESSKVDYLGVAYADEGMELREENIQLPIIVMNAEEGSFDKIINNNLEPSIYSFRQLDQFIRALIDNNIKSYPIHIKIDTGMKRLGFMVEEIEELISTISSQPEVRIKSIFSHLAASDSPKEDLFTNKQIQIFQYICHQIETGLGYNSIKHILNSSGIERFSYAQMDMVRLGLGMYGESSVEKNLKTVGSLSSVISQIKKVKKGESVGYGRSQYALRDSRIGVIPIGYADGYSRMLSDGHGTVWINGHLVKTFGKVCMDMMMVDLTDITAKEGDHVEIFGSNKSIKILAKEMDTITYEVMTSISQRVVRVYIE